MRAKTKYAIVAIIAAILIVGVVWFAFFRVSPTLEAIKIGVVGELTGPWAYSGNGQLDGLNFAVEKINKEGGVLGRNLTLVVTDSKSDTTEAITLFKRLAEVDNVSAIIGGVSSSVGIALSPEAEKEEVPTIMSWAASEKVHALNSSHIFRSPVQLTPPVMQGVTEYIKDKGYTRVGMLIADYAFGRSVEANLKSFLEDVPGVQIDVEAAPVGETDFTSYIRKLQDFDPDILINGHPPGGASAIKQMIEMGMDDSVKLSSFSSFCGSSVKIRLFNGSIKGIGFLGTTSKT